MKKIIILIVTLSFITALVVAGTSLFKNFVYIQNVTSPFYGGTTQKFIFTFDSDYNTNQTFYILLKITSNDTNYPVWMNDFSANGTLQTVSGFINKMYLLNCYEQTNGTFLCYNGSSTNQIILPNSHNIVNLSVNSQVNLYPGNYTFQLSTLFFDITPPDIILISPPNNSLIRSGTPIDLDITDDGNISNAYWSKTKYFFDDFSGGSGNWTPATGTWAVESNEYSASIGSGDAQSYINSLTVLNASIETKFKILTGTTGKEWIGIHARKNNPTDSYTTSGYIAYIRYNGEAGIYKAGYGDLVTTNVSYDPTLFNTLKFVLSGNVLKVMLNDIEIMKTTDNIFNNSYVSLWSGWSSSTHAHFDDVKITDATILNQPYDIYTTGWSNGLTKLDVFAYDESGNSNHSTFAFNFDNIPPRVNNSSINANVELGDNAFARVDAWDENGVDKVIVEDYYPDTYKFDFNSLTSPLENGFTNITRFMLYNGSGYGWSSQPSGDRDRLAGINPVNLTRDLIFDNIERTFVVDLPNNKYLVSIFIGDMNYSHDNMDVYANNELKLNDVANNVGQIKQLNFTAYIKDGHLNITFKDDGGSDPNWTCEGLIIRPLNNSYVMTKMNGFYKTSISYPGLGNHIIHYLANDTLNNINDTEFDSYLVTPTPPPRVVSVDIYPSVKVNNSIYLGIGSITFNITFDKMMDRLIPLSVTFGNQTPYNSFKIYGSWETPSKIWFGIYQINSSHVNSNFTLNISGGKDLVGNLMVENTSTDFIIDTFLPRVLLVELSDPSPTKAGIVNFTVIFNMGMDTSISPMVTFGRFKPYSTYLITPIGWINSSVWVGYYNITPSMPNVWYTISVSGAKDLLGREIAQDTSHRFLVDTKLPKIWDINTADITVEENETTTVKVKDDKPIGQEESGLDTVLVELNGIRNFTMNLGYNYTYIGGVDSIYYRIIRNSSYTVGTQNLTFYVNDTAGNMAKAKATFYVNSTIPEIGGKIAFLCRYNTCSDDIEDEVIDWLRSKGWNVTGKIWNKWTEQQLSNYDLIMCSDESYACDYGSGYRYAPYKMHKFNNTPFVEIGDNNFLKAAKNFDYVMSNLGYTQSDIKKIYVTVSDTITSGHFGNTKIFNPNRKMTEMSDTFLKLYVKDLADANEENSKSTMFKKDIIDTKGRFVYVGWFNGEFSGLSLVGDELLTRAINWAQCGNAKGCVSGTIVPSTTTTTTPTTTIGPSTTSTTITTTSTTSTTTTAAWDYNTCYFECTAGNNIPYDPCHNHWIVSLLVEIYHYCNWS